MHSASISLFVRIGSWLVGEPRRRQFVFHSWLYACNFFSWLLMSPAAYSTQKAGKKMIALHHRASEPRQKKKEKSPASPSIHVVARSIIRSSNKIDYFDWI